MAVDHSDGFGYGASEVAADHSDGFSYGASEVAADVIQMDLVMERQKW